MSNPYQPPVATIDQPSPEESFGHKGWLKRFAVIGYLSPVLFILTIYSMWLLAWATLGHKPIPMIDDPKEIPNPFAALYIPLSLLFLFWIFVWIFTLLIAVTFPFRQRSQQVAKEIFWVLFFIVTSIAAFAVTRIDPFSVIYWMMD